MRPFQLVLFMCFFFHFGSEEAKTGLADLILDKSVRVRLLGKDQFGRAVGETFVANGFFSSQNAADVMLQKGLGYVYKQSGALYGKGERGIQRKAQLLKLEEDAKARKVGVWGLRDAETPSEFKARLRSDL
jgi:endonuclease YncB( thermonuclease family)